jgi:hypothetical protein
MKTWIAMLAVLATAPQVRAQERLGFHVRAWVQWDDQRIDLGDGYVGGPYGIGFTVKTRLEGASFTIKLRPAVGSDSVRYVASIETRLAVSDSLAPSPLFAFDSYRRAVAVQPGDAAELILPFHPEPQETATLRVRIEGPSEPRPADTGKWIERIISEPREVYFRHIAYDAAVTVTPDVCPGALAVRLAASGTSNAIDVLACGDEATVVTIPRLRGRWIVTIPTRPRHSPDKSCLMIGSAPPEGHRGRFEPRSWGTWCVPEGDRWAAASIHLSTGETIRAQLIP